MNQIQVEKHVEQVVMPVDSSNKLAISLLFCPNPIAVVTGDACMLEPVNYGARIAFVDYEHIISDN